MYGMRWTSAGTAIIRAIGRKRDGIFMESSSPDLDVFNLVADRRIKRNPGALFPRGGQEFRGRTAAPRKHRSETPRFLRTDRPRREDRSGIDGRFHGPRMNCRAGGCR